MSKAARLITGFSEKELKEYEFPSITSRKEINIHRSIPSRSSVRLYSGKIAGLDDRMERRKKLALNIPDCIKYIKK